MFSEEKLRSSIHRAGVSDAIQDEVVAHIKGKLYENMPTSEIYRHIAEFLDRSNRQYVKAKYSLKQAIMALGPTGYPFEDFIAKLLETQGYVTQTRTILMGKCVSHEIDVIAKKDGKTIMIEAKFHNSPGARTDVQVALYTHARFEDVRQRTHFDEVWLVTNTKITADAIHYGSCVAMGIISWSYPNDTSLRDLVEKAALSPITSLTSLSQAQIQQLLENHVLLCIDILKNPQKLSILSISEDKRKSVIAEANFIIQQKETK